MDLLIGINFGSRIMHGVIVIVQLVAGFAYERAFVALLGGRRWCGLSGRGNMLVTTDHGIVIDGWAAGR